jgi:hypothetical protein
LINLKIFFYVQNIENKIKYFKCTQHGMANISIHHTCVSLQEYITLLFIQAIGHTASNGLEKCCQVVFKTINLTLNKYNY